jgi:hypothetical protein
MTYFSPIRSEAPMAAAAAPLYGDSVKTKKYPPVYAMPEHHFLFYLCQTPAGRADVRRMWDPRVHDIIESEKWLFHLAKGPKGTPTYLGQDFIDLHWRFPCYISFVLDNDDWKFDYAREPITFRSEKDGIQYDENYSFYNAVEIDVPILDSSGNPTGAPPRKGLRIENHIKADINGTDLGPSDYRRYKMDLQVLQPNSTGTGHTPLAIDPDGQNQGPPSVP